MTIANGRTAAGAPIDLNGRTVPLRVEPETWRRQLETTFSLNAYNASRTYGLLVPGTLEVQVELNGRPLDVDPLPRADGRLYLVDPMYLRPGTNGLAARADLIGGDRDWGGTVLFSLEAPFESVHFAEVFRDEGTPGERPATLADIAPDPRQAGYDVLWYDCTWKVDMTGARLQTGSSVLMGAFSLIEDLQEIVLDFDRNPNANGGGVMNVEYVDSGASTPPLAYTLDTNNNLLIVTLPAPIPSGTEFQIRIGYSGTPNNSFPKQIFGSRPFNRGTHGSPSRPVVYTASQPYGARRWWPCKDFPGDKATTTVQRIIVPNNLAYSLTAVSNGKLAEVTDNGNGTATWVWQNSHPISTYLLSLAVSNYQYVGTTYTSRDGNTTMPVGHYIYPENIGIEGNGPAGTLQVLNFFANTFGEYPFLSEKYVTATWNISFAIEHQTCTSMPAGSNSGVGNGLTRRNIHELSHQWFGDKVTCHNWDNVWLNEGFATYCEALWDEFSAGKAAYHAYVNSWSVTSTVPVVNPDADAFAGSVVYRKGAWVLHMLRRVLGDDAFFRTLRTHAAAGYTTALSRSEGGDLSVGARFEVTAENAAGLAPGTLKPFFDQWLHRPNGEGPATPTYAYSGSASSTGSGYDVTIQLDQLQGGSVPFTMPLEFKLTDAAGASHLARISNDTFSQTLTLSGGTTRPVEIDFDPENWVLNNLKLSINTVGLPSGRVGTAYSRQLRASGGSGYVWSTPGSLPPGLLLSSSGVISGTPTQAGLYEIPVSVASSPDVRSTTLTLQIASADLPQNIVINEVLYDPAGTDVGEFIELKNNSSAAVDLGGCKLILVDGATGTAYSPSPLILPSDSHVAPGGHFLIGNAAVLGNEVNWNLSLDNILANGAPDAIVLRDWTDGLLDAVAYEADAPFVVGPDQPAATSEGGTGAAFSTTIGAADNISLSRLPDGQDSGSNLQDFTLLPPTPGYANAGTLILPFSDSFDPAPSSAWRKGFAPVRSVSPGGSRPAASPAGGKMLEVVDSTGGGDVAFLSGTYDKLKVEAWLWIPPMVASNGWSTGLGIATRNESAWFSSTTGYALETGYYLEYQNGPMGGATTLKGGAFPVAPAGTLRLLVVDSSPTLFTGLPGAAAVTAIDATSAVTRGAWNYVRLTYDRPANRLIASVGPNAAPFYNGPIPGGNSSMKGGVVVGFRENHSGTPAATEATLVDGLFVTTDTGNSAVSDWSLY